MASKSGTATTSGSGARKCQSWIGSFIDATASLEAPAIFRKWSAISTIAAVLEQKVWVTTSRPLYPNLYVVIVGHPGVGKTRTIRESRNLARGLKEFHLAPVSLTAASLTDALVRSKRFLPRLPDPPLEYNSMYICADELGTFIHKYDNEMISILSAFYDPDPYSQARRKWDDEVLKIQSPQLNILAGTQPSALLSFMPEGAWEQGFASRMILVFSDERTVGDDFATTAEIDTRDLEHDLNIINSLSGKFTVTESYRERVNNWRSLGEPPIPSHPKLIHYVTRRRTHLYKLSMVASVNRDNSLALTVEDFNTAYNWLCEAEVYMPEIFKAGVRGADAEALDDIEHFVQMSAHKDYGVPENKIVRFASKKIPAHSILRIVDILEKSGRIHCVGTDKHTKIRWYKPGAGAEAEDLD